MQYNDKETLRELIRGYGIYDIIDEMAVILRESRFDPAKENAVLLETTVRFMRAIDDTELKDNC